MNKSELRSELTRIVIRGQEDLVLNGENSKD